MQHLPEPLVSGRIAGGLHSLVILAQELGTFLLRKTLEDHLWIARILLIDWLGGHAADSTPAI
jgi:hypothetical protein